MAQTSSTGFTTCYGRTRPSWTRRRSATRENFAKAGEFIGVYLTVDLLLAAGFVAAAVIAGPLETDDAEPLPPACIAYSNACETADGPSLAPPAGHTQKRGERGLFSILPSDDIP